MRVAFITLYDYFCHGARILASNLLEHGHEAHLILFKEFRVKKFHYASKEDLAEKDWIMNESGHKPVLEYMADGDLMCPYPTPATEREKQLLIDHLRALNPDVIGLSLTSAFIPLARELSLRIREEFPGKIIMWGGIHTILRQDDAVGYADAICITEADDALLQWLEDPFRTDIDGFWHMKNGQVVHQGAKGPLPQDLDRLPFPMYGNREREIMIENDTVSFRDLTYYGDYILLTGRGCPFMCTFCFHSKTRRMFQGTKYLRRRSVDRVLDEVETMIQRFPFEAIVFWDDIFMVMDSWVDEFCRKYKDRFDRFPFGAYGHYQFTNQEMLDKLKDAGCIFTSVGIQSGSHGVSANVYGRRDRPENVINFTNMIVKAGIHTMSYDVLTNSRFETEADCRATLELLTTIPKPRKISLKKIQPYPTSTYAELNLPDGGVSEKTFEFYNLLYILAGQPEVDGEWVRSLADDAHLREDIESLRQIVLAVVRSSDKLTRSLNHISHLEGSLDRERQHRPRGIKQSTQHLLGQVKRKMTG